MCCFVLCCARGRHSCRTYASRIPACCTYYTCVYNKDYLIDQRSAADVHINACSPPPPPPLLLPLLPYTTTNRCKRIDEIRFRVGAGACTPSSVRVRVQGVRKIRPKNPIILPQTPLQLFLGPYTMILFRYDAAEPRLYPLQPLIVRLILS